MSTRRRRAAQLVVVRAALALAVAAADARGEEPRPAETPAPAAAAAADSEPSQAVAQLGREGLSLRSADGDFTLRLRVDLQLDGRYFVDDAAQSIADTWLVRRARPVLDGTLFGFLDFRLMPDFGGGQSELYDAYLEARLARSVRLRVGKFRPPLGLERLQSSRDLLFLERAAPTLLVPNRDVGLQLGGAPAAGRIEYQVGYFNGVVDGGRGDLAEGDGGEASARLVWRPFGASPPAADLGIGLAASVGQVRGTVASPRLPAYKSFGAQTFFRYRGDGSEAGTAVADGRRSRLVPQAFFYAGPFGLLAEYARSGQEVRRGELAAALAHGAWQVQLSWVLTGERNGYKGIAPERPFDASGGGRGAWIVAVRATGIDLDDATFPRFADPDRAARGATAWGACLSWNLTRGVRWMLDLGLTRFDGGAAGGADRSDEKEISTRFQLSF